MAKRARRYFGRKSFISRLCSNDSRSRQGQNQAPNERRGEMNDTDQTVMPKGSRHQPYYISNIGQRQSTTPPSLSRHENGKRSTECRRLPQRISTNSV